ncbi:MAG: DUF192 domain-containing protein [Aestuariibacter sp.]
MHLTTSKRVNYVSFFVATVLALLSNVVLANEFVFEHIDITVGDKQLNVEYANTFELRAQGLQFRTELCPDCGMLFKFEKARQASMWMKNTLIPLDVAFINNDGEIVNIEAMEPLDLNSVLSKGPVRYALEMNQGWFAENGLNAGDRVMSLP